MELNLSTAEAKLFAKLTGEATDISSTDDFRVWSQTSVRKFFPHEMLIAGIAQRSGRHVSVDRLISVGFPMGFIEAVKVRLGTFACPTLESWFLQGKPQLYDPGIGNHTTSSSESTTEFIPYDLKNVAAHGAADSTGDRATYFSFSQIPQTPTARHASLLKLLVPPLCHAFEQATLSSDPSAPGNSIHTAAAHLPIEWVQGFGLSPRELQILYWLHVGKNNDEIGLLMSRSRNTIKHQVGYLYTKLNVRTRSEAVTLAIRIGLLPDRRAPAPHPIHLDHHSLKLRNRPTWAIKKAQVGH